MAGAVQSANGTWPSCTRDREPTQQHPRGGMLQQCWSSTHRRPEEFIESHGSLVLIEKQKKLAPVSMEDNNHGHGSEVDALASRGLWWALASRGLWWTGGPRVNKRSGEQHGREQANRIQSQALPWTFCVSLRQSLSTPCPILSLNSKSQLPQVPHYLLNKSELTAAVYSLGHLPTP